MALLSILLALSVPSETAAAQDSLFLGTLISRDNNNGFVHLSRTDGEGDVVWPVKASAEVRAAVATLGIGDQVEGVLTHEGGRREISVISPRIVHESLTNRLLAFGVAAAVLVGLAAVLVPGGPRWLIIGEDNRYSNSKTQLALWFLTAISAYLATVALRMLDGGTAFVSGVSVPPHLLWLSGISALTFAGAKYITVSRIAETKYSPYSVKRPSANPTPRDLVTDDSGVRADLGDFQMLVITLVAVSIYSVTIIGWLKDLKMASSVALPEVDSTLLGAFGIGQATYLAKKMAGDAGTTAAPGPIMERKPPRPPGVIPQP